MNEHSRLAVFLIIDAFMYNATTTLQLYVRFDTAVIMHYGKKVSTLICKTFICMFRGAKQGGATVNIT